MPRGPQNRKAWCDPPRGDGVRQRAGDVLLAHDVRKPLRTPLSGQDQVRLGRVGLHVSRVVSMDARAPKKKGSRHPLGSLPLLPSGPGGVHEHCVAQSHKLACFSGERGIRTLGTLRYTRFPIVPDRPLRHLSGSSQCAAKIYRDQSSSAERLGGEGGIRTPATVARRLVFETSAFNHSATSPQSKEHRFKERAEDTDEAPPGQALFATSAARSGRRPRPARAVAGRTG